MNRLDRRTFIKLLSTAVLSAPLLKAERAAAAAVGATPIKRAKHVTPPGIVNREHFHSHCTACQLCVSKCPQHVLKPSTTEYGIDRIMQPVKDYSRSFCRAGCTRCTNVCSTGALTPLTREQKLQRAVGYATTIHANCLGCGECASTCPTEAITMTDDWLPTVNHIKCIGCGACEYACPARPVRAIYVEGI